LIEFLGLDVLTSLFEVVLTNLVLSGDNVIVIGLAAAGLPGAQRGKAILIGIVAATALRVLLAGLATQILQIVGLLLAGGLLLLWVCWKIWRELRAFSAVQWKRPRLLERSPEPMPKVPPERHSSRRSGRSPREARLKSTCDGTPRHRTNSDVFLPPLYAICFFSFSQASCSCIARTRCTYSEPWPNTSFRKLTV
jgi:hypothetical protein